MLVMLVGSVWLVGGEGTTAGEVQSLSVLKLFAKWSPLVVSIPLLVLLPILLSAVALSLCPSFGTEMDTHAGPTVLGAQVTVAVVGLFMDRLSLLSLDMVLVRLALAACRLAWHLAMVLRSLAPLDLMRLARVSQFLAVDLVMMLFR